MARPEAIRIEGLAEFNRNLRKLDKELPKALRLANNEIAGTLVHWGQARIPTRRGRARKSLRAKSTRTESRVVGGGARAPYFPWLDFGGRVGRGRTGRGTGSVRRAFYKDGRYIYAGYFKLKESGELQEAIVASLLDVARQAGIEVE